MECNIVCNTIPSNCTSSTNIIDFKIRKLTNKLDNTTDKLYNNKNIYEGSSNSYNMKCKLYQNDENQTNLNSFDLDTMAIKISRYTDDLELNNINYSNGKS